MSSLLAPPPFDTWRPSRSFRLICDGCRAESKTWHFVDSEWDQRFHTFGIIRDEKWVERIVYQGKQPYLRHFCPRCQAGVPQPLPLDTEH